ncbi:MAG: Stp1/IreP family PP2C-type Ser/Thr phosphatase [Clostridia bacterium]|nr:Stp1/IreP family PP2C-type Ser/Thr phosphatase [Clostridia bacterium]
MKGGIETEYFGITDKGLKRASNQDCFAISSVKDYLIAVVCDGMGGVDGGNIASEMACDFYVEKLTDLVNSVDDPSIIDRDILSRFISNAVSKANFEVYREALRVPALKGMGTTLVTCVIKDNMVLVGNVGDSRLYHITKYTVKQITKDHSFVQTLLDAGKITESEAAAHPNKNIITRAVGVEQNVQCDIEAHRPEEGYLLLCSDGLSNYIDKDYFIKTVNSRASLSEKCSQLVAFANSKGGADNITAVLIRL